MRGSDQGNGSLFSYVDMEQRVRPDHPLRVIREIANASLKALSADFDALYAPFGRASIPPERLVRALLLQAFYSIRSERQLVERIEYDLLFRWFVGLGIDEVVWDATTFTKNRDRLLDGDVAAKFLSAVLSQTRVKRLLSSEHFSVDGTLIEAWASPKSFKPKDGWRAARARPERRAGFSWRAPDERHPRLEHGPGRAALPPGPRQGSQALVHGPRAHGKPQWPDRWCRGDPSLGPCRAVGRDRADRAARGAPAADHARRRQELRYQGLRDGTARAGRHAPRCAERHQPPFGDRRAHDQPFRLCRLDADQKADRGSVRLGQDRRRVAQDAPPRPAEGRLAVHPRDDSLQSHPTTEIVGGPCLTRARMAPLSRSQGTPADPATPPNT